MRQSGRGLIVPGPSPWVGSVTPYRQDRNPPPPGGGGGEADGGGGQRDSSGTHRRPPPPPPCGWSPSPWRGRISEKRQRVCKPGSVHRPPIARRADGRPFLSGRDRSRPPATNPDHGAEAAPYAVPIRSCSRWGLPCRSRCRARGALLPHPFALTVPKRRRCPFCGTVPGVAPAGRYPAPCFPWSPDFPRRSRIAAARPSGGARTSNPLVVTKAKSPIRSGRALRLRSGQARRSPVLPSSSCQRKLASRAAGAAPAPGRPQLSLG